MVFYNTKAIEVIKLDCKKCIMCTLLGGMAVYGYLKYKDGTLERTMKNIKPKIESAVEGLKK